MSESFSICDGGACSAQASLYAPAVTFESSCWGGSCTLAGDSLSFTPMPGYDSPMLQADAGSATSGDSIPNAFKPGAGVKYERGQGLKPVDQARERISQSESPKIKIESRDQRKHADILIHKDGAVEIADGIAGGDRALKEYNIQVDSGTDRKITEKVINDLGDVIMGKCRNCTPTIDGGKDSSGSDLITKDFIERFRKRFDPKPDGDDLPDNPDGLDDGRDGGQPGPCPRPGPRPGPEPTPDPGPGPDTDDSDLKPDKDDRIDPSTDRTYNERGFQALNRLSDALNDMHPMQYAQWLGLKFLPEGALSELGDPPWTGEKLNKLMGFLKAHQGEIAKQLNAEASSLEAQGDTASATAIREFERGFATTVNDPQKLESFATAFSSLLERTGNDTANPTDVHAVFNNDAKLEKAVRHLTLIDAGRKIATATSAGHPDLTKISNDKADKLIAELHLGPKRIKDGEKERLPSLKDLLRRA